MLQARAAVAGVQGLSGDLPGVGAGPPKLEHFSLTGAVPASVIRESTLPNTLKSLHLSYFPFARLDRNHDLILGLGTQIITEHRSSDPAPGATSLDGVLALCPGLINLFVSADYICGHFCEYRHARRANGSAGIPSGYPLARLELDSSGASNLT